MPLSVTGKNNLIAVSSFTHAGALTALPSTETSGGSYARQPITWAAAASGARANSAQLTIPIAAGQTIVAASMHDALSAGAIQGYYQIGSTLRGAATVTTGDTFTSVGHGLAADDRVFVTAVGGDALPTGLAVDTLYFVRATGLTADAFTLSTTSGGAAVDVTAAGECAWFKTVPQTFAIAGNLVLPATTGLVIDVTAFG
jgi:hypothetical protein